MAELTGSSRPCLAAGCRWTSGVDPKTLVFPEGALRLRETAYAILDGCDGQRTVDEIIEQLRITYSAADPVTIKHDVIKFLGELYQKRLVDFR